MLRPKHKLNLSVVMRYLCIKEPVRPDLFPSFTVGEAVHSRSTGSLSLQGDELRSLLILAFSLWLLLFTVPRSQLMPRNTIISPCPVDGRGQWLGPSRILTNRVALNTLSENAKSRR